MKTFLKECYIRLSGLRLKSILSLLGCSFLMVCSTAYASNFRGGSFSSASITANGKFSGTFVSVWQKNDLQDQEVQFEVYRADDLDRMSSLLTSESFKRIITDNSDPAFTVAESKFGIDLSKLPRGLYFLRYKNCCRVHRIKNQTDTNWGVGITVNWNGRTNSPPVFNSSPVVRLARHQQVDFKFEVNANDADGDNVTYQLLTDVSRRTYGAKQISGFKLHPRLGLLSMKSANTFNLKDGLYVVKVAAIDSTGSSSEWDMMVNVMSATNKPPMIDPIGGGLSQSVTVGETLEITYIRASDPDGDNVIFTATGLPDNSSFTGVEGRIAEGFFTFTPKSHQGGKTYGINIEAKDDNTFPLTTFTNLQIMVNEKRKINQTITFRPLPLKSYGDRPFFVNAKASSDLSTKIDVVGECKISPNNNQGLRYSSKKLNFEITLTGAGSCKVIASQNGNAKFNAAPNVIRYFNITKAAQHITFKPLHNKIYGSKPFTISVKASSKLPINLSRTGNCTLKGRQVIINGVGLCQIRALQNGNANYEAAKPVVQRFNIEKATQTITFGTLPNKTFGDKPFAVSATASSRLPINGFMTGNCTLKGNQVFINGAGGCQLTASQNGNANYKAAMPVVQHFKIEKAIQTITFGSLPNKTFGDKPFVVNVKASSGLIPSGSAMGNCTLKGNQVFINGAGSCKLTAFQKGDANYKTAKPVVQSFKIEKATQSITFGALINKTFGDKPFFVSAISSSGLLVSNSASGHCSIKGSQVFITGAGHCKITASQNGDVNYKAAKPVVRSFNIDKASQDITFDDLTDKTFGDKPFLIRATATSGRPVRFTAVHNCTLKGNNVIITGAGRCKITVSQEGNVNYKPARLESSRFNIDKASQSISFGSLPNKTYGDKPFTISANASSDLPVKFTVSGSCTIEDKNITVKSAGICQVTALQNGDANYKAAIGSKHFKIGKATQSINLSDLADKTFGDKPFTISAYASSGIPVSYRANGDCTIQDNQVNITGAGSCQITALQNGNMNYKATTVTERFKIGKASQSITFNALPDKIFREKPFIVSATASSGLPVHGNTTGVCSIDEKNRVTINGAGSCLVTILQEGDANYKAAKSVSHPFKIGKAIQTISLSHLPNKIFGEKPFMINAEASSGLPISAKAKGNCSILGEQVNINGAGSCQITVSQEGNVNYKPAQAERRFDIGKSAQSITIRHLPNKTYGDKPFVVKAQAESKLSVSYVARDQCTIQGNRITITGAGSCQITASQNGNPNYKAAKAEWRRFKIDKASQSIAFSHLPSKTFGEKPFTVNAEASSKLPVIFNVLDNCRLQGHQVIIKGAGNCQVTASQNGNANYKSTRVTRIFNIDKATQSITFQPLSSKTFGDKAFVVEAEASSKLPVSYLAHNQCTIQGNQVTITGAGNCQITALQKGNANYKPTKDTKRININKKSQSITFNPLADKTFGDKPLIISATASSGLPVHGNAIGNCSLNGNRVIINDAGHCQITAVQKGDVNYKVAEAVERHFNISKASQSISFKALADKTFGDKPFAVHAKASSGLPIHFNASGSCKVEDNKVTIEGAGNCNISVSQKGDANYKAAKMELRTFKIGRASQFILFGPLQNKTFGDKAFEVSPKASSGLAIKLSVVGDCNLKDEQVFIKQIGNCQVTATQEGNANYHAAEAISKEFMIEKASQSITFKPLDNKTYRDEPFIVIAKASSGLPVNLSATGNCSLKGNQVNFNGAGRCQITASQKGDVNHKVAKAVVRYFKIDKAAQSIIFNALNNKTFGDKPFKINAVASLPVSFKAEGDCTLQGNQVTLTGAGSCQVTASQNGNANYKAAKAVLRPFEIDKATQTISVEGLMNKTYGDEPFAISAQASSGLPVQGRAMGKCRLKDNQVGITGAGGCIIMVTQAGNANYKSFPAKYQHTFKIAKAAQTITFSAIADKTYGDEPFAIKAIASSGLLVTAHASGDCRFEGKQLSITGAGSCKITVSQEGNANYEAAKSVLQSFKISKAAQRISFKILEKQTFGGQPFMTIIAETSSGLPIQVSTLGNCTFKDNYVNITGRAICQITVSQEGDKNYEPAKTVKRRFNAKISQSIDFEALDNKTFGDKPFTVKAKASSKLSVSFRASDPCTVQGEQVTITGAGSCQIMALQKGDAKYKPTSESRRFKIDKAVQSITFAPLANKTYDNKSFTVYAQASSGLPVSGRATGSCRLNGNKVTLTGVGSCQLTALQEGNANYKAAKKVSRDFKISKGNQSIRFVPLANKTYGDKPFTVYAKASSGLPVSGRATGNCRLKGNQVTLTGVGNCQLTVLQEGNANYKAATEVSSFNIGKGNQSIHFAPLADKRFTHKAFAIHAKASSGLPVSFNVTGHCRLLKGNRLNLKGNRFNLKGKGNRLKLIGLGLCQVTASQKGNAKYKAAASVSQEFNITKAEQSITFKPLGYQPFVEQFKLTATSDSDLPISYKSSNPLVATVKDDKMMMTGIGTTTITASQAGNANFNAAKSVSQEMIVFTTHAGVVQTININRGENLVKVFLEGKPTFGAGSSCQSYWCVNSIDNDKFMKVVMPILMAAKLSKQRVRIWVSECEGRYPKIYAVDLEDRI
ncbi:MAG: hypothetical protein KAI83_09435 [Thiomargarita sp.]|nr:hypothetical protein [Thiomargarita sp.]